jgi:hypothetical protein
MSSKNISQAQLRILVLFEANVNYRILILSRKKTPLLGSFRGAHPFGGAPAISTYVLRVKAIIDPI